ncbi:C45 family autoproteolytic acyltransferase/hydrolase, partial [Bacteroidota bacterium]
GDEFAKNKMILFVRPDSGYAFASITWAGFMGVVSGMNEHGLTVTLNAAKSSVPNGAKTPISILAREILQYARTIDEAYIIAKSRETFVSESILIGSAAGGKAAIIEKSPDGIDIFYSSENKLVCSNHYQSERFLKTQVNQDNIKNSDSFYRYKRMSQLLNQRDTVSVNAAVEMLRNQEGIDGVSLGMGNPKAVNQLLAHHGVVFLPHKRQMWVSTSPFQLGAFLCYDLNQMFSESYKSPSAKGVYVDSLVIVSDVFLTTENYQDFLRYKELKNRLFEFVALGRKIEWNEALEEEFVHSNAENYITYSMLGDYYLELDNLEKAKKLYAIALSKEVASLQERKQIQKNLELCH